MKLIIVSYFKVCVQSFTIEVTWQIHVQTDIRTDKLYEIGKLVQLKKNYIRAKVTNRKITETEKLQMQKSDTSLGTRVIVNDKLQENQEVQQNQGLKTAHVMQ